MSSPPAGWLGAVAAAAALAVLAAAAAWPVTALATTPSTPDAATWMADGSVNAIARANGTTYIGGEFTNIGPPTGHGVAISAASGQYDADLPEVDGGQVYAVASDGSGGWYIGGDFASVGGQTRSGAAHILAAKTVDPSWNPSPNGAVRALAVSGPTAYAGGDFTSIGGQPRNRIAALDSLGAATAWDPNAGAAVNALALSGSTLYVGGSFTEIDGVSRSRLAAVDAATGEVVLTWSPRVSGGIAPEVRTLAVSGATVYVGGAFTLVGTSSRNRLAAVDTVTGAVNPTWNPNVTYGAVEATVRAVAVSESNSTVYFGGEFSTVGGVTRSRLAAVGTDGSLRSWNPSATATVNTMAVSGSTVYAGGAFTKTGRASRNRIAAYDTYDTSGTITAWDPNMSGDVNALAVSDSTVYAGGAFASANGQRRNRVAALDATGQLTSWNPDADDAVNALVVSGSTIYAGGAFSVIGGQFRTGIAALDTSGAATSWDPAADNIVHSLAVQGNTVYAGGDFTSIGGQLRNRIAALDATVDTNMATSWDPDANAAVLAIAVSGNTVYAGGDFTFIGGQWRNRVAALDAAVDVNMATAWDPSVFGAVRAIAVSGSTVYVGGDFTQVGTEIRNRIAALDATTNTNNVTPWDPNANLTVRTIAVSGTTVYAGGAFTSIGGQGRTYVAALDTSGLATSWNPSPDNTVNALAVSGSSAFAGGAFTMMGTQDALRFAAFTAPPESTAPPAVSGTPSVGETLSCSSGSWENEPTTYAYAWRRDGVDIPGATGATYTPGQDDAGKWVACSVTASNVGGSGAIASEAVMISMGAAGPVTGAPGIQPADPCAAWLGGPLVSATHWRRLGGGLRLRVRTSPGGYVVRSQATTRFLVDERVAGRRAGSSLTSVDFSLDGEPAGSDRTAPYALAVSPGALSAGYHRLAATAHAASGEARTLRLGFYASDCDGEAAALSVSMSSKLPGAHPDLDLWVRTGGAGLRSVRFSLPPHLRLSTGEVTGRIGAMEVFAAGGSRTRRLRIAHRGAASDDLTSSGKLSTRLGRRGGRPTLSVQGLDTYSASGVRLALDGKATRMIVNPASCDRRLPFAAELTFADGTETLLSRTLEMCKGNRARGVTT